MEQITSVGKIPGIGLIAYKHLRQPRNEQSMFYQEWWCIPLVLALRRQSRSLRPAWFVGPVLGQPELHRPSSQKMGVGRESVKVMCVKHLIFSAGHLSLGTHTQQESALPQDYTSGTVKHFGYF